VHPLQQAVLEFVRRGADGAAVAGVGDFPEEDLGISVMDTSGVANKALCRHGLAQESARAPLW